MHWKATYDKKINLYETLVPIKAGLLAIVVLRTLSQELRCKITPSVKPPQENISNSKYNFRLIKNISIDNQTNSVIKI